MTSTLFLSTASLVTIIIQVIKGVFRISFLELIDISNKSKLNINIDLLYIINLKSVIKLTVRMRSNTLLELLLCTVYRLRQQLAFNWSELLAIALSDKSV